MIWYEVALLKSWTHLAYSDKMLFLTLMMCCRQSFSGGWSSPHISRVSTYHAASPLFFPMHVGTTFYSWLWYSTSLQVLAWSLRPTWLKHPLASSIFLWYVGCWNDKISLPARWLQHDKQLVLSFELRTLQAPIRRLASNFWKLWGIEYPYDESFIFNFIIDKGFC